MKRRRDNIPFSSFEDDLIREHFGKRGWPKRVKQFSKLDRFDGSLYARARVLGLGRYGKRVAVPTCSDEVLMEVRNLADTFFGRTTEEIAKMVNRPLPDVQCELEYLAHGELIAFCEGKWLSKNIPASGEKRNEMGRAFTQIAGRSMKRHNGLCAVMGM